MNYSIPPFDFWIIVAAFVIATAVATYHITKNRINKRHQKIGRALGMAQAFAPQDHLKSRAPYLK